jgi:hypothetical protein
MERQWREERRVAGTAEELCIGADAPVLGVDVCDFALGTGGFGFAPCEKACTDSAARTIQCENEGTVSSELRERGGYRKEGER